MNEKLPAEKISGKRAQKILKQLIGELLPFLYTGPLVEYCGGSSVADEMVNDDYRAILEPVLDIFSDEELRELLKEQLPEILRSELGAERVTIKWKSSQSQQSKPDTKESQ